MKKYLKVIAPLGLVAGLSLMATSAQAQFRTGPVSVYQNYGMSNPFVTGSNYGYGGYGYNNQFANRYRPTFIYRSPASLARDRSNDPYRSTNLTTLESSIRRFQELRDDSRREREFYSNETYRNENPFDELYYLRTMTP